MPIRLRQRWLQNFHTQVNRNHTMEHEHTSHNQQRRKVYTVILIV